MQGSSSIPAMAIDQPNDASSNYNEEGIAIAVGQESVGFDDGYDPDSEVDHAPLNVVRPESMGSELKRRPGGRVKERAQRTKTYKRKRGRPSSKSVKSDKDVNFVPKRKRGRPAGSKSAKSKIGRKPALSYSNSSDGEGERGKDYDSDPPTQISCTRQVPDADGRKKYTRVQGICGPAFKIASEVHEKFPGEYPIFTRCMVPSNVLRVFWLHISSNFCRRYLPKHDAIMTLEDEDGKRDYAKYLSDSYGLSGGWRNFAKEHCLKVGDTVVFELVKPTKFKVYITRRKEFPTTDGDVRFKEDPEATTRASNSTLGDDADNLSSEEEVDDANGMKSPDLDIKDSDGMPSFKSFNIFIDGLLVNPELFPDRLRGAYYELCRRRNTLLHKNLPTKINQTLVIGVIMETANIAEGIRAGASSREDLAAWKKILESFELLGMDVSFLRKRADDLLGLMAARSSTDQQPSVDREGYEELNFEKDHATEKMRALKSKMATLQDALKAVDIELEEMESSVKKNAQAMREIATAPW